MSLIIVVSDLLDMRARKQKELALYTARLDELIAKLCLVQREIDLTYHIVDLIREEKIFDLKHAVHDQPHSVPYAMQFSP